MAKARVPAKVQKLKGSENSTRLARRGPELELPAGIPEPPMPLDADALEAWAYLLSESEYAVVISRVDRYTLAMFAKLWARFKRDEIKATELQTLTGLIGRLGLSPADRAKIKAPEKEKPQDPWAQYQQTNSRESAEDSSTLAM